MATLFTDDTGLYYQELCDRIQRYAFVLGQYLSSLGPEDRRRFRNGRGVQGQTATTRSCQHAIHERIPEYLPDGLLEYMATEKAQTNTKAKAIADNIEIILQQTLIEELKQAFQLDNEQWWYVGIPKTIRGKVSVRQQEDDNKRGGKENYFDLLDYRHIILENWKFLGDLLGYTPAGAGKQKRTAWIEEVNEIRKIVAHASAGRSIPFDQLAQLEGYEQWLQNQVRVGPTRADQEYDSSVIFDEVDLPPSTSPIQM